MFRDRIYRLSLSIKQYFKLENAKNLDDIYDILGIVFTNTKEFAQFNDYINVPRFASINNKDGKQTMCYYTDFDAIYSLFYNAPNPIDLFHEDLDFLTFFFLLDSYTNGNNSLTNRTKVRSATGKDALKYSQKFTINKNIYL